MIGADPRSRGVPGRPGERAVPVRTVRAPALAGAVRSGLDLLAAGRARARAASRCRSRLRPGRLCGVAVGAGLSTQRSRAETPAEFQAVSLNPSPSHVDGAAQVLSGHMPCYAKDPLPSEEDPELRKLVAGGEDLNPRPLGYESDDRRPSRLSESLSVTLRRSPADLP